MDKQTIFEAMMYSYVDWIASNGDRNEPCYGKFATIYILGYVLSRLRPNWFHNEKQAAAHMSLISQMEKYREKSPDRDRYASIAYANGLSVPMDEKMILHTDTGSRVRVVRGIVNPADVGLCFSSSAKDRRFVRQAILQYLKRGFPRGAASFDICKNRKKVELAERFMPVLAKQINTENIPFSGLPLSLNRPGSLDDLPRDPKGRVDLDTMSTLEEKQVDYEMSRYATMLLGEVDFFCEIPQDQKWKYINAEDGTRMIDPNSKWAREASCLRPTSDACIDCQPEFIHFLATLYYVYNSGLPVEPMGKRNSPEKDHYFQLGKQIVLPFIDSTRSTAESLDIEYGNRVLEATQHKKRMEMALHEQELLKEELAKLKAGSKAVCSEKAELQALEGKLKEARKLGAAAIAEVEQLKRAMEELKKENDELVAALGESNARYNSLNEQMIDLIEDNDDFLDDEITLSESESGAVGIRAKIGEAAYEKLSSKRIAIVGGHENTCSALRAVFPNWKFFAANASIPDSLSSLDAIGVVTTYVSHQSFLQAKNIARNKSIQLIPISHNGPTTICRTLTEQILSKVS